MGERYWVTGVQLGMLKAFNELAESHKQDELIEYIIEHQFMGRTNENVSFGKSTKKGCGKRVYFDELYGEDVYCGQCYPENYDTCLCKECEKSTKNEVNSHVGKQDRKVLPYGAVPIKGVLDKSGETDKNIHQQNKELLDKDYLLSEKQFAKEVKFAKDKLNATESK